MSVKLGIDLLENYSHVFENKRVGLLTNATGINSKFESTVDLLKRFNLVKLFAPEHGIRGNLQAGVTLQNSTDEKTGLPVYSLYGSIRKPTAEQLNGIDVFAFDIQDVGSRFYTYLYSMAYIMEACRDHNKEFVVFDRPNPINALVAEGNVLDLSCKSFIGLYPITQRHGLTIGEAAKLFNEEFGIGCNLTIIKMENYCRGMYFEDTGLKWVLPSPNIPTVDTCFTFNCSCIFEGTNVSEGRGTTKPFTFVGAPWIDGFKLADSLNQKNLPGILFRPHFFTPFKYHPKDSKYPNELCGGVELFVLNRNEFAPVKTAITMLYTIREMYGDKFMFLPPYSEKGKQMIDYNTGNTYIREWKYDLDEVLDIYKSDAVKYTSIKSKYHLY